MIFHIILSKDFVLVKSFIPNLSFVHTLNKILCKKYLRAYSDPKEVTR